MAMVTGEGDDANARGVDAIESALVASARASDAPLVNQQIKLLTNKRQQKDSHTTKKRGCKTIHTGARDM